MVEPLHLQYFAWAITTFFEVVLFLFLLSRKQFRSHPAFFFYILIVIVQNAMGMLVYRRWGFRNTLAWDYAWGSQALVASARACALVEVARGILAAYKGIWAFAWRMLLTVGVAVFGYSLLTSKGEWHHFVMSANRGVELSIAAVIVTLLLFARYYQLPIGGLERSLATGFCLYSCFSVINFSIFERYLELYANFWSFLDIIAFLASLFLWIAAVQSHAPEKRAEEFPAISKEQYAEFSAKLDLRLHILNEQLNTLLHSGAPRA